MYREGGRIRYISGVSRPNRETWQVCLLQSNLEQSKVSTIRLYPGGGTLNVEVIGMLVGNFFVRPKKYPDFDFKPLKIPKLQF